MIRHLALAGMGIALAAAVTGDLATMALALAAACLAGAVIEWGMR